MLKLEHVYKTFMPGSVNEKKALTDVNLHIKPGDFVTVIGGNGAGKSTLMNIISGVFYNEGGKITLDGQDITRMPEHKRAAFLGRVFQPCYGKPAGKNTQLALGNYQG